MTKQPPRTPVPDGFMRMGADQKISPDVWEDMRVLLAFSRAGTIAKCAELLGVTQPTIIRRLANLETNLDRKLLVRSTRGSSLTQEGQRLVALADQIDRQVATAIAPQVQDASEIKGTVRVSSTDGLLSYWLAPMVHEFQDKYPGVALELFSTNTPPQLERREIDIVLSFLDFQSTDVFSKRVGFVHLVPYVSKQFVLRHGMPQQGETWENYPVVDHVAYRAIVEGFEDWIKLVGTAKTTYMANNSTTYYHMVRSGLGIGFLGNYAVLDDQLIPIEGHPAHSFSPLYVGALRVLLDDPSVKAVFDWVTGIFDQKENPWFRQTNPDIFNLDYDDLELGRKHRNDVLPVLQLYEP